MIGGLVCLIVLAAPAVDWDAVGRRDGLVRAGDPSLHGAGGRRIARRQPADLDGRPPLETLVHVQEYVGEGAWTDELHVYRGGQRLGSPWVWGGYRDQGWWRVEDFDGDGRDEVLVVGDTAGDSPSETALLVWRAGAFEDRMWSLDPGVGVVPLPPEAVGEWVLLGLRPGGGVARCVALRAERWRPAPCPTPTDGTALLQAVLARGWSARPDYTARGLAGWLRSSGAWVEPDAVLPAVLAELDRAGHGAWPLLHLLAWPGGPLTAATLAPWLDQPLATGGLPAVAAAVAAAGDRAARERVLGVVDRWVARGGLQVRWSLERLAGDLQRAFVDAGEGRRIRRWRAELPARKPAPPPALGEVALASVTTPKGVRAAAQRNQDQAAVVRRARALAAAAADQAPWVAATAQITHPDAQAWRAALLVSGSPAERAAVAAAWPVAEGPAALARALAGERAARPRRALVQALGRHADPVAHKALMAALAEGGDLVAVRSTFRALVQAKAPQPAVLSVLRASDCTVLRSLMGVLADAKAGAAQAGLAQVRARCPDDVRGVLVEVLSYAAHGPPRDRAWARPIAQGALDHPDRAVRRLAAQALVD